MAERRASIRRTLVIMVVLAALVYVVFFLVMGSR